jgi:hypothetical protein
VGRVICWGVVAGGGKVDGNLGKINEVRLL